MRRRNHNPNSERGYILLTLVFFVAVLAISLATILPSVIHEARRDREDEMVHRGTQYERAIRLYFKKNGRYPAKIEDLENTNEIRYLRKRYKDPMAARGEDGQEQDFKILRFGDPGVHLQQGAIQTPQAGLPGAAGGPNGLAAAAIGQLQAALGANAASQPNLNEPSSTPDATSDSSSGTGAGTPKTDANGNPVDPKDADSKDATAGDQPAEKSAGPGNQSFGGGAMVGVVSTNRKDTTIREFNRKHHYYEWQFIYDPTGDRGGLPKGPWQPPTFSGQPAGQPVGQQIGQPIGNPPGGSGDPKPIADPQQ